MTTPIRRATVRRTTRETAIDLTLAIDGRGEANIQTGIGFFDHMLTLLAGHARFDLSVSATGDLHVDDHHTVEDVGICLGDAIRQCIGSGTGICRYGSMTLPMDETLATVAVDLSGRRAFVFNVALSAEKVGTFDTELAEEFWRAVANAAGMNFHALLHHGRNSHHILEATFKAAARALRQAVAIDPMFPGEIPSTKGTLT